MMRLIHSLQILKLQLMQDVQRQDSLLFWIRDMEDMIRELLQMEQMKRHLH